MWDAAQFDGRRDARDVRRQMAFDSPVVQRPAGVFSAGPSLVT